MFSKCSQLLAVVLCALAVTEAVVFTRCQVASILLNKYGYPRSELADWVCLIESESGRNTAAVGPPNYDGSRDYGLFQINSYYWCSGGANSYYNECSIPCSALTTDDITNAVTCAKKIYARQGFSAWYGWINKCKGKDVSIYIAGCGI